VSDILDVSNSLVAAVMNAVYPPPVYDTPGETWDKGGDYDTPASTAPVAVNQFDTGVQFSTGAQFDAKKAPSVSGTDIVIYAGWPQSDNLAADLANGKTHITVFPKAEERNTTRYPEYEHVIVPPAPTLTLKIGGPVLANGQVLFDTPGVTWDSGGDYDLGIARDVIVTVGGTVSVPQNLALRINNKFYTYAVQKGDTLASIATALASLVAAGVAGTSVTGAAITIGPTGRLQAARIGGFGTVTKEVRRQERVMMITVWANAPGLRDLIAAAVDVSLAETKFLCLPDGFGARLIYKNSMVIDADQKAGLYRRDLNYHVEYATTVSKQRAAVIAPSIALGSNFNSFAITA
jgi:hypothetical protein